MANFPPPPPPPPPGGPGWGPPTDAGFQPPGAAQASYASWTQRVGASLLDGLIGGAFVLAGFLLAFIFGSVSDVPGGIALVLGYVGSIAFSFWNLARQGRTGQTIGKGVLGITLVRLGQTGPPGVGLSIGRSFLHIVDALPCYLGFLWPLWDKQRQTFTDKILETVVVTA